MITLRILFFAGSMCILASPIARADRAAEFDKLKTIRRAEKKYFESRNTEATTTADRIRNFEAWLVLNTCEGVKAGRGRAGRRPAYRAACGSSIA